MNRRQQIVLFFVVVALMMTWLFPHWIPRYKEHFRAQSAVHSVVSEYTDNRSRFQKFFDGYSFLFTQEGSGLKIDWGRLFLTDLMIATVGVSLVYVLRSKS
jgi:hypothetical protein